MLNQNAAHPLITARIDHGALVRNLERVQRIAAVPVMAVVKADAFGHGAVEVARTLVANGAAWLGVATVDEALQLREAGIVAPILSWLLDARSDLDSAVRSRITLACSDAATLAAVAAAAAATGSTAQVHFELDSGMSRGGCPPTEFGELCRRAARWEREGLLSVGGVWSHLAAASDPGPDGVLAPVRAIREAVTTARRFGLRPRWQHLANSAGALAHPATRLGLVRAGAALYGIETVQGRTYELEPALRLTSRVLQVRRVAAGTGVGYGPDFVTARPTRLALIPVGYADGLPRALSGRGTVGIRGVRHQLVGRVSMDQAVADVGDTDIQPGDEVVLLGDSSRDEPDAAEWAALTGTVPHEILTGLGHRVVRTHVGVAGARTARTARGETPDPAPAAFTCSLDTGAARRTSARGAA